MKIKKIEIKNQAVADIFASFPESVCEKLLEVRELIFGVAKSDSRIGELSETVKWNEPAYLTEQTKSGTTIRINKIRSSNHELAIYFNCKTTLVESFRIQFPKIFKFDKNRAIIFSMNKIPIPELKFCIHSALVYKIKN